MAKTQIQGVAIRGVVCAVPGEPMQVADIGRHFGEGEVEKIAKTVGLGEVYRVGADQTAGDLAVAAAEALMADLGWERESVDGVIMVTQSPDHFCPATACIAHGKLGLPDTAIAFDVNQGCSGYVYGLYMASQFVKGGGCKRFLMLAGDTSSLSTSSEDRSVAMLFGDAGTATALELDPDAEPMSFVLGTDGTGAPNLVQPAGGYRQRMTPEVMVRVEGEDGARRAPIELYMDGLAIFNFTLKRVPPLINEVLALHGWERAGVDAFLFHQANGFILNMMRGKLKLAPEQVPVNIQRYGNTSMSSIPLLIADDLREQVTGGEPVKAVLAGFGIGYSWAAVALTFGGMRTARVINVPRGEGRGHTRVEIELAEHAQPA
jgi:3-oxoacyl-[acyl-carrier-protein] synthase-3